MEIQDILTPSDLYGKELYVKGSRVRVRIHSLQWNGENKVGIVDVKFLDVPDENCYKVCKTIQITPGEGFNSDENRWYYEGKFDIKDITKVPFGSEFGKVLYGAQKN